MGAVRVRWSTLARWVGGGLALLLALQALPPLLRPPAPEPLAADIGLPRVRAARSAAPTARVARVSSARALPRRRAVPRRAGGRSERVATPSPPPAPAPTEAPPPALGVPPAP